MSRGPFWTISGPKLPLLETDLEVDVCVVGLGGAGLSALEPLAQSGRRVVGIDAVEPGAGASGRNGGFLLAGAAPWAGGQAVGG